MVSRDVFLSPVEIERQLKRARILLIVGVVVFAVLTVRLWQIQIREGAKYRRMAAMQSSRVRLVLPQRGLLLDREGRVIVDNQPGLRLRFFPERATDPARTEAFLRWALRFPPPDLGEAIAEASTSRPYRPETLVEQLSRDALARIDAQSWEYPELEVQTAPLRRYPHGEMAAHLVGYLGEIDDEELEKREELDLYAPGDVVGKQGVERTYDPWLFGTKGREIFRVDASGRVLELLESVAPRPGWDLSLHIDLPTQQAAEAALGDRAGAVVALDPADGGVLAIASRPSFDPALFIGGINQRDWQRLRNDPDHPLEYRPVRGVYPPGSTFKPAVGLAALAHGEVDPEETVYCPGHFRLGRRTFRCWKAGGHGKVDLHKAIVESCDTYFYEMGKRLGIERLAAFTRRLGLGVPTGLDLAGEKGGLVPDPEWKAERGLGRWQGGETVITAIGQGSLLATPLQMASLYAVFANGGHIVTPHLRREFQRHDRPAVTDPTPLPTSSPVDLDDEHLAHIRAALEGVVHDEGGTGGYARIRGVRVAGKTGTAQVIRQETRGEELEENLRDHAWFVAYAPADDPQIVVAVIVEHGGHGGSAAAPVARQVMEAYLKP